MSFELTTVSRQEDLSAGPGRGQHSRLRVYARAVSPDFWGRNVRELKVDVRVDHSYPDQGHARLYEWTPVGWQEASSLLASEVVPVLVPRAGDSLEPVAADLIRIYRELKGGLIL